MERSTPVRNPHSSTADLLTWSDNPPSDSLVTGATPRPSRSYQPSDGISKVVFGGQVTDEEVQSLNRRKPCSDHKMKEITGSGIFSALAEDDSSEVDSVNASNGRTGVRMYQKALSGISHISFGEEEVVTPKKPTTSTEVAKQRELSGTLDRESDAKLNKQLSDAKCKELSGHNIFAPPPEIKPRSTTTRALALKDNFALGENDSRSPAGEDPTVKTAKKIYEKKFSELSGDNIFTGDSPPALGEKHLSMAKLREISGNDIFADVKVESRDYLGGVRKPPGGESSIALV